MAPAKIEKPAIVASATEIKIFNNAVKLSTLAKLPKIKGQPFAADLKKAGLEFTKDATIADVSLAGRQKIGDALKSYGFTRLTIMGRSFIKDEAAAPRVAASKPAVPKVPAKPGTLTQLTKAVREGKAITDTVTLKDESTSLNELGKLLLQGKREWNQKLKVHGLQLTHLIAELDDTQFTHLINILKAQGVRNFTISGTTGATGYIHRGGAINLAKRAKERAEVRRQTQANEIKAFMREQRTVGNINAIGRLYRLNPEVIQSMVSELVIAHLFKTYRGVFVNQLTTQLNVKGHLKVKGIVWQGLDGKDGKFDIECGYDTNVLFCDENEAAATAVVRVALGDSLWKAYGEGTPTSFRKRNALPPPVTGIAVAELEDAISQTEGFNITFRTHAANETGAVGYVKRPKKVKTLSDFIGHLVKNVPLLKNSSLRFPIEFVIITAAGRPIRSTDYGDQVLFP